MVHINESKFQCTWQSTAITIPLNLGPMAIDYNDSQLLRAVNPSDYSKYRQFISTKKNRPIANKYIWLKANNI